MFLIINSNVLAIEKIARKMTLKSYSQLLEVSLTHMTVDSVDGQNNRTSGNMQHLHLRRWIYLTYVHVQSVIWDFPNFRLVVIKNYIMMGTLKSNTFFNILDRFFFRLKYLTVAIFSLGDINQSINHLSIEYLSILTSPSVIYHRIVSSII